MKKFKLMLVALFGIFLVACSSGSVDGSYEGNLRKVPTTIIISGEKFEMKMLGLTVNGKKDISSNTVLIDFPGQSEQLKFTIVKTSDGIKLTDSNGNSELFKKIR